MRARARCCSTTSRPAESAVLKRMGTVSALCNDSELRQSDGVWKVEGDPTEAALYPFAAKLGLDRQAERAGRRRIDAIPFEFEHKFMATLHEDAGGGRMLLVKGAPEVILAHCGRQETESGPEPLQARLLDRRRRTAWRRRASACSDSPGCPIRASRRRAWRPAICRNAHPARTGRPDGPAAQGSGRGGRRMPQWRHSGDDDHGRSQDHGGGDRQNARHRRRQEPRSPAPRSKR